MKRGKGAAAPIVVKIGGELCGDSQVGTIAEQIGALWNSGVDIVLVHGGGPQIDAFLASRGVERKVIAGKRVTDRDTLDAAKMLYNGLLSANLVAALRRAGVSAAGLSGADGGLIMARKMPPQDVRDGAGGQVRVDYGLVGDVTAVDETVVHALLERRILPVICSLGIDEQGDIFNINADTVAVALAAALSAAALIVMTNVPGVMLRPGDAASRIVSADVAQLRALIADGVIRDGMIPKVEACITAVQRGVARALILDGTTAGTLTEAMSPGAALGTAIVSDLSESPDRFV